MKIKIVNRYGNNICDLRIRKINPKRSAVQIKSTSGRWVNIVDAMTPHIYRELSDIIETISKS